VVTGHFLRHADRVGVTLEAMDVAKDEVTWRGSVDVDSKDMLMSRKEMTALLQAGIECQSRLAPYASTQIQ
jgi:TolB-like protein